MLSKHRSFHLKLKSACKPVLMCPTRDRPETLLLHGTAHPHSNLHTTETTASFEWTALPHPQSSPHLVPFDCHLSTVLKNELWGGHFQDDGKMMAAVQQRLHSKDKDFYKVRIQTYIHHWKQPPMEKETMLENNCMFSSNIARVFFNAICWERKIGDITFWLVHFETILKVRSSSE